MTLHQSSAKETEQEESNQFSLLHSYCSQGLET